MTLYPRDKAVTDAPVTLLQGDGWVIHGTGCVLDLKTNTVKLLSKTDTLIIPHKPVTENPNHETQTSPTQGAAT